MPEDSGDQSPNDDYFNDLSQQPPPRHHAEEEERRGSQEDAGGQVPKPKRIACVLCRKRKLRCDGDKPSCGTCVRLQHDCSYDEVRRKSGPKRGYVKALEARLAQVETLLKTQDEPASSGKKKGASYEQAVAQSSQDDAMVPEFSDIAVGASNVDVLPHMERTIHQHDYPTQSQFPHATLGATGSESVNMPAEEPFPWEMIGLGLDEPLPTQDVVDELNRAYFEKIHPSLPMMHRPRYHAAMNLAPYARPPVCLRYAMWCNAASVTDKYETLQEHFYHRARKYVQQDEMKGHGESMITVAHCQTWALLATYEFRLMYFPRAWMSAGRASRLGQMMGLHRLDGSGMDVKQCLPPPRDWTEREERRRTFWMCFCIDRYSSIGTGWPMAIEEVDVMTTLPSEEHEYELNRPGKTMTLSEALDPQGASSLSSFAGVVLMACMFGRNLAHLHRPGPDDRDEDLNGEFWKRHREMDNTLLNISLALPDALRFPAGLGDANIIFMNMNIHTSTICLHQAAIFKSDKNRLPGRIAAESKVRCITAASEIASMMRQISHLDLSSMNPFMSFCLYVAARVFVQYLKSRPKDAQVRASLQFLLAAMHALKRKNPLTESFLVQLDVDLESSGLDDVQTLRAAIPKTLAPKRNDGCAVYIDPLDASARQSLPTYGDSGLAMYNQPNAASGVSAPTKRESLPYQTTAGGGEMHDFTTASSPHFDLPNRQRTRSPAPAQPEMDLSPDDGSGGGDHRTPSSSSHSQQNNTSSNTSNTAYSPQDLAQQYLLHQTQSDPKQPFPSHQQTAATGITLTAADFDMPAFLPHSDTQVLGGFIVPQDWGAGGHSTGGDGTGLTPDPMTSGGAAMNDLMGMTDADWDEMCYGTRYWGAL